MPQEFATPEDICVGGTTLRRMTAHVTQLPPLPPSADEEVPQELPACINVKLKDTAVRAVVHGAEMTGRSNGDFIVDATLALESLAEWERAGYRIVARRSDGQEFPLSPVILGLKPSPSH